MPDVQPQLSDVNRAKLDGIVAQMQSNHESDSYIQGVVNDFKTKYGGIPAPSMGSQLATAAGSFVGQTLHDANPANLVSGAASLIQHPIDTLTAGMSGFRDQAAKDFQAGNYMDAINHGVAGVIPVLGPAFGRTMDAINSGNPQAVGSSAADLAAIKTVPAIYGAAGKVVPVAAQAVGNVAKAVPGAAKALQPIVNSTPYGITQDVAGMTPGGNFVYGAMRGAKSLVNKVSDAVSTKTEIPTRFSPASTTDALGTKPQIILTSSAGKGVQTTLDDATQKNLAKAATDDTLTSLNQQQRKALTTAVKNGDNATVNNIIKVAQTPQGEGVDVATLNKAAVIAKYLKDHPDSMFNNLDALSPADRQALADAAVAHGKLNPQGLTLPNSGKYRNISDNSIDQIKKALQR